MFPFEKALNLPVPDTWAVSTSSAGEVGFGNVTDACKTQNEICFNCYIKSQRFTFREKLVKCRNQICGKDTKYTIYINIYNSYIANFNVHDLCSSAMLLKQ